MQTRHAAAAAVLAAVVVAGCASQPSPMEQNAAAHPAVPCSQIAGQVRAVNRFNAFPGPVGDPGPAERKLAADFANVSAAAGTLARAEVTFTSDMGWLPAGSNGYNSAVLDDAATLARLCH